MSPLQFFRPLILKAVNSAIAKIIEVFDCAPTVYQKDKIKNDLLYLVL